MKKSPILFSTAMVSSLLNDTKSMTRRTTGLQTFNEHPDEWIFQSLGYHEDLGLQAFFVPVDKGSGWYGAKCPYGNIGDLLWVREAFCYRFNDLKLPGFTTDVDERIRHKVIWKPSIHMPKSISRIWLQITEIKVERLMSISESDCIAEGIEVLKPWPEAPDKPRYRDYWNFKPGQEEKGVFDPMFSFMSLFGSVNKKKAVYENPWVWVIKFKIISKTGYENRIQTEIKA